MADGTCPYCGEFKKNLGAHKRFCKDLPEKEKGWPWENDIVVDDYLPEKPLSSIISEIKQTLRQYRTQIEVKTVERGGKTDEIEILARIQLRR